MRATVAVLVGAAAVLGPLASAMGASPELQLRDVPEAVELGDLADEAKTVVNSSIDDAAGGVVRYGFELSSPQSVEVVLRLLSANLDVFLEDAWGEVLGSGTELGRSDERFSLTLAAGSYVVRLESVGPVGYRLKLKVTEPVGEPVGTRTNPGLKTDPGTESDPGVPADLVEAWTSVLDVGASDDGAGYSRWAQFGSLTPVQFEVDGSSYDVILLAEVAGGLYLGLRRSLDTEFTLEIDGQQFIGSDSLVPAGLALRGTYWWPTNGVLSASLGGTADVSLSVGSDTLPERGAAPPGAWFSDVPDTHDGSTSFALELNFDEADVEVTAGSMADALTVTGGSLGVVTEVSPAGKTWELTVTPDAAGDVTVSLNAPTDCVTAHAVCTADGRMLRNTAQAVVRGTADDDDPPASSADLSALTVDGVSVAGFSASTTEYQFGVDASVAQVTVSGVADGAATVAYSGTDADRLTDGHQLGLSEGRNVATVTVTAADGNTTKEYTVSINRGSEDPFGWSAGDDFDTLAAAGNKSADGLWSDGTTMWVSDDSYGNEKIFAYTLATKQRDPSKDIRVRQTGAFGDAHVRDIWSDGTTMWVANHFEAKLFAYTLAGGQRDPARDLNTDGAAGNESPMGLWSDGTTMWVSDLSSKKIFAYTLATGQRDPGKDIDTDGTANTGPVGLWSDGTTMWVADSFDAKLYAFTLADGQRDPDRDFDTLSGHGHTLPWAIWSDGATMWVSGFLNDKIFAYNMPGNADPGNADLSALTVDGVSVAGFSASDTAYQFGVGASVARVTVLGVADGDAAVVYSGTDADSVTDGHQVDLSEGRNNVRMTVTAADGRTRKGYTVSINRGSEAPYGWSAEDDFDTLAAADNRSVTGLWSDGTTMWVADDADGSERAYAYTLATKQRDPGKDIDLRKPSRDTHVRSIWSDGTTMWMGESFDNKLYAFTLADGQRDPGKDIDIGDQYPYGLWSDGTTMWVSDVHKQKIFAYTLADGQRDPGKDFDTLDPANARPAGLWSDGTTMWVANSWYDEKIFAYTLADGQRDPDRDFDTLFWHVQDLPRAIWSDGATMWVGTTYSDKLFAYNMPGNADLSALSLSAGTLTPAFGTATTSYTVSVGDSVSQVTVTAQAADAGNATVVFLDGNDVELPDADDHADGQQVDLALGDNTIKVQVTASDLVTTRVYTLTVHRVADDAAIWAVSVGSESIAEEGETSTAVTVSTGGVTFTEAKTVTLVLAGTATEVADYTVTAKTLTLAAGETSAHATVTAVDDTVRDADESIEITAMLDGAVIGVPQTITIADNDEGTSGSCSPVFDPTPTAVAVTAVPIEVASNIGEYFVLYVNHQEDGVVSETPVAVIRGEASTTMLAENVAALPPERYRVEKYLITDPADVDGDCVDDLTELDSLGTMSPVNPAPAIGLTDGAAAVPDQPTFETLAYGGQYVKFVLLGMDTDSPTLFFINSKTHLRHPIALFLDAIGHLEADLPWAVPGEIVYDPALEAPDGSTGVYYWWLNRYDNRYSTDLLERIHTLLAAGMPLLDDNLALHIPNYRLASYQSELPLLRQSRIPLMFDEDIHPGSSFLPMNPAVGYGRLRVMEQGDRPHPRDIAIYEALPNELPRVAGIITTVPQTPLSHVNLRAVQDGVPNAFISDALNDATIDGLLDSYVRYEVTESGWSLRAATPAEVDAHYAALRPATAQVPQRDLSVTAITPLSAVGFEDWDAFGVKAANVAVLGTLGFPPGTVPEGFAVPFYFYDEFMKHNGFYDDIEEMLADESFQTDFDVQEDMLKDLRKAIKKGQTPTWILDALTAMHATYPVGQSLRYRSSTNNEDLPGFSGAGLYDSKTQDPDETVEDGIDKSIKGVYASLWNFRAFTEREFHRIDHLATAMGVLVHPNYTDELANGVAVSFDPVSGFDGYYYVNTQLGEDLVTNPDAYSEPEEILLHPSGNDIAILATSNQVEPGELLLDDAQLRQLGEHLEVIHDHFKTLYDPAPGEPFAMEIEFKITSDDILAIKQARPWVFSPSNQTATGLPTITGTAQEGETLSADTSGISDANGLTNVQFSYQWIRSDGSSDTDIVGATGQTHTLTHDDVGKAIKVQVSFTDDHGFSETLTSDATAAVAHAVETLWSGEMTVADYGSSSLGAYNDDTLFSNVTSSIQLQVKWLWYLESERKLCLAFRAPASGTGDWKLRIDDAELDFPSGNSNFVFRNVDLSWTADQVVNVSIVRPEPS
ncbi:cadherin-like beta sandwich domain-containing protein [Candidatus Poriferisodalis sp.]|uniref:cadherin-like beta sandwich domain-containing protein n=1 Tax=Candidatus Poriferisodalis sp. TaxID=3101277 RepID=UPI003B01469C